MNFDLVFAKKMKITETLQAELRVEGYNIFNHPNFTNPGTNQLPVWEPDRQCGNFGLITSTVGRPDATTSARQMQVALKLNF